MCVYIYITELSRTWAEIGFATALSSRTLAAASPLLVAGARRFNKTCLELFSVTEDDDLIIIVSKD